MRLSFNGQEANKALELELLAARLISADLSVGRDPHQFERDLGIPAVLAKAEETILESMSGSKSLRFPTAFVSAVPVGKTRQQLTNAWHDFAAWRLEDDKEGLIRLVTSKRGRYAIERIGALCRDKSNDATAWSTASNFAYAAANAESDPQAKKAVYTAAHIANTRGSSYAADAIVFAAEALTPPDPNDKPVPRAPFDPIGSLVNMFQALVASLRGTDAVDTDPAPRQVKRLSPALYDRQGEKLLEVLAAA